jgi:hypothetical protein
VSFLKASVKLIDQAFWKVFVNLEKEEDVLKK